MTRRQQYRRATGAAIVCGYIVVLVSGIPPVTGALLVAAVAVYMLPSIVAVSRDHHNAMPIVVLNLFLGWTFVGWVVALVWALTEPRGDFIIREGDRW